MSVIDVESLLADLPGDAPCGPNLEYDADYVELERLQQGKPEQQFGETIIAAEPPDWKALRRLSLSLLSRTRDLRIAVCAARALLVVDGLPGFSDGLQLISGLIQRSWTLVHPQLDPDDGNDPVMRVNALATLCEPLGTVAMVRDAALVAVPAIGRFTLRDIEVATGEIPPPAGQEKPALVAIDAAFANVALEQLVGLVEAAEQALAAARAIEQDLMRLVGSAQAIDMSPLSRVLERALEQARTRLTRRPDFAPPPVETAADATDPAGAGGAGQVVARAVDRISNRDEVVKALSLILEYYDKHEPSSPVPLLIERARRLVPLPFLELMRDLAPDHVAELEKLKGKLDN